MQEPLTRQLDNSEVILPAISEGESDESQTPKIVPPVSYATDSEEFEDALSYLSEESRREIKEVELVKMQSGVQEPETTTQSTSEDGPNNSSASKSPVLKKFHRPRDIMSQEAIADSSSDESSSHPSPKEVHQEPHSEKPNPEGSKGLMDSLWSMWH